MVERVVQLAVGAGLKRKSKETGFIHRGDTIPLLENFCFALALLRTKVVENVLEAKALLERLLPFQVEGQFPYYLHEYPTCRERRVYPAIYWILHEFKAVLGEELKERLEETLQRLPKPAIPENPSTPEAWAEFLIAAQIGGHDSTPALAHFDTTAFAYTGPQQQDRFEPAVTLYDLFLGQAMGLFSRRAEEDHFVHLRGALIRPFSAPLLSTAPSKYFWGDRNQTHSFALHIKEDDEMPIAVYCNIHPQTQIFVKGQKATTFQLGEEVTIVSGERTFTLDFSVVGEGNFFGHISRGNRPHQIAGAVYDAFDWKIALRTVRIKTPCTFHCNVGLSTATPIACMPLST